MIMRQWHLKTNGPTNTHTPLMHRVWKIELETENSLFTADGLDSVRHDIRDTVRREEVR